MNDKNALPQRGGFRALMAGALALLATGALLTWATVEKTDRELREALLEHARLVAHTLNIDRVKALTGSDADLEKPYYLKLKARLAAVKRVGEKYRFVYVMGIRPNGEMFYFVDNEPADSKNYSPPGQLFTDTSVALHNALVSGMEGVEGPITGRRGTWVSAVVPLTDPAGGGIIAALGMDVEAGTWRRDVFSAAAGPTLLTLLALVLLALSLLLARSRHRILIHQESLRKSEEEQRQITEAVKDYVYSVRTENGKPVAITYGPGFFVVTGYQEKEFGTEPGLWLAIVHPEDRAQVVAQSRLAVAGQSTAPLAHRMLHKNGEVRWVTNTLACRRDRNGAVLGYDGLVYDITDRKHAEDELAQTKALLQAAVEQTPAGMLIADAPDVRIRMANPAALGIRGDSPHPLTDIPAALHPQHWQTFWPDETPIAPEDLPLSRAVLRGEVVRNEEVIIRRTDGESRCVLANAAPVRDAHGNIVAGVVVFPDITDRKRAEEKLREDERRADRQRTAIARLAVEQAPGNDDLDRELDRITEILSQSAGVARAGVWMFSENNSELRCLSLYEAENQTCSRGAVLGAQTCPAYFEAIAAENRVFVEDARNDPRTCDLAENYLRPLGITSILNAGILMEGRLAGVVCCEHVGTRRRWHADEESFVSTMAAIVAQLFVNIERIRAEEKLRRSKALLRLVMDSIPQFVFWKDRQSVYLGCNQNFARAAGIGAPESIVGKTDYDLPWKREEADFFLTCDERVMSSGWAEFHIVERQQRADGKQVWLETNKVPLVDEEGKVIGILGTYEDITEREKNEQELSNNYLRTRALLQLGQMAGAELKEITDFALEKAVELTHSRLGYIAFLDDKESVLTMHSWSREAMLECSVDDRPIVYPVVDTGLWGEAVRQRKPIITNDYPAPSPWKKGVPEGHVPLLRHMNVPIFDGDKLVAVAGVGNKTEEYNEYDIQQLTLLMQGMWRLVDRKRAEEERMKLQAQLNQSQKMESVGRLAGGVAHDFNNMLGVILGRAELALERVSPDQPVHADLQEICAAAERSADFTQQLLAFARKQTVAPKILDLNETVEGMLKMLRRLIGEDIDLAWLPGTNMGTVRVDPSQIDQILANLCVNARDAIGNTGRITIETAAADFDDAWCADHAGFVPGPYLLLAVSDNGCGMDREVQDKLFEPFFTTKELGKGTGLGLSTVYGIVRQNNGFIDVYSEPGQGTTFKIYLPEYTGGPEQVQKVVSPKPPAPGCETILLVEDEPGILKMAAVMLERRGYTVLAAAAAGEALHLAETHAARIDLLMTDVVMPDMNGRELAETLLARHPKLKVLFMSGYTADVIAHHGILDEGVHYIQKPFSTRQVAEKVREVLDCD